MKTRFYDLLLAGLLIGVLTAGCASTSGQDKGPAGTGWKLITLNGQPALPDVTATIIFGSDGQLSGSTGCNQYTGTYDTSGSQLTLVPSATTMMACPDPVMKQEQVFMATLSATSTYSVKTNQMTLKDASGNELATLLLMSAYSFTNTQWSATGYNNGSQAVVSVVVGSEITAIFGTDGSLNGYDGCNNYNGVFKASGNTITIQLAASTKMACPQPLMDQETQYLNALEKAATFKMGDGTLELHSSDGALQVSYQAKP